MHNITSSDFMSVIERHNEDFALAEEYRRGGFQPTRHIMIDELVNLLKSIRKPAPVPLQVKRHAPAPVSREQELAYFHHFMHRNHNRNHGGLQGAR